MLFGAKECPDLEALGLSECNRASLRQRCCSELRPIVHQFCSEICSLAARFSSLAADAETTVLLDCSAPCRIAARKAGTSQPYALMVPIQRSELKIQ